MNPIGNDVGIGTSSPGSKLDVRGSVKLGNSGEFFAAAGSENLRMVRGNVNSDGTILAGAGFSMQHLGAGTYRITFATAFGAPPTVVATPSPSVANNLNTANTSLFGNQPSDYAIITTSYGYVPPGGSGQVFSVKEDVGFSFVAIGPR